MKLLNLTLPDPESNIALDEALLEVAASGTLNDEVLRVWHPTVPMVVLGRSSKIEQEVNLPFCRQNFLPIIRRCSGGASILTAPGCLMYAVVLSYERHPALRQLDRVHRHVTAQVQAAIRQCGIQTDFKGTCDLTLENRKVSGNALRCKRHWVLYHGTLLCAEMDLTLVSRALGWPARQPVYRRGRSHSQFLTALPVDHSTLAAALIDCWNCHQNLDDWPRSVTKQLVADKYSQTSWTHQR